MNNNFWLLHDPNKIPGSGIKTVKYLVITKPTCKPGK